MHNAWHRLDGIIVTSCFADLISSSVAASFRAVPELGFIQRRGCGLLLTWWTEVTSLVSQLLPTAGRGSRRPGSQCVASVRSRGSLPVQFGPPASCHSCLLVQGWRLQLGRGQHGLGGPPDCPQQGTSVGDMSLPTRIRRARLPFEIMSVLLFGGSSFCKIKVIVDRRLMFCCCSI